MVTGLILLAAFLAGAVLYRIRGGWLPTGSTQTARAIWCVPIGILVGVLTGSVLIGALTVFTAFAGLMIPHGNGQDMGRDHDTEAEDFSLMSGIGIARLYLILLPSLVSMFGWVMLIPSLGIAQGIAYFVGWRLPVRSKWLNNSKYPVDAKTAWAELIWGGVQSVTVVAFFLLLI